MSDTPAKYDPEQDTKEKLRRNKKTAYGRDNQEQLAVKEKLEKDESDFIEMVKKRNSSDEIREYIANKFNVADRMGIKGNSFLAKGNDEILRILNEYFPVKNKSPQKEKEIPTPSRDFPNALAMLSKNFPEKEYLVFDSSDEVEEKGLLPLKGAILLGAAIREGKTTLALDLAINVATGGKFLNHFNVKQGKVLYCLKQGDEEFLHNKLRNFFPENAPQGLENLFIDTFTTDDRESKLPTIENLDSGQSNLDILLKNHEDVRLIVFDMIDDYLNIDNVSGSEKMRITNELNNYARKNDILILALKHTAKIQKDYAKKSLTIQGHMKELGGYSGNILLRKGKDEHEIHFELREGKVRDIRAEFLITDKSIHLEYTGEENGFDGIRRKVYNTIELNPRINAKKITALIYGESYTNGQYQNIRGEVSKLEKIGVIERRGSRKTGGYEVKLLK